MMPSRSITKIERRQPLPRSFTTSYSRDTSRFSSLRDRKSTRLNSSHTVISYAVFCLKNLRTTEIYPLSLHDALPILHAGQDLQQLLRLRLFVDLVGAISVADDAFSIDNEDRASTAVTAIVHHVVQPRYVQVLVAERSEEHTSELQSHSDLVCRLLLEKSAHHRDLPSFPTRRSSDLTRRPGSPAASPLASLR